MSAGAAPPTAGAEQARLRGSDRPLAQVHDLLLLDLDGVVYVGPDAVPTAPAAIERARAMGLHLSYVTNNASRPAGVVAEHLTALGMPTSAGEVVTSAMAAASLLRDRLHPGARVLVVGGEGLRWALRQENLVPVASFDEHPEAVVQGFSPDVDWRQLAEGTRAVRSGLPYVASNTDLTVPTRYGPAPGNGTLVAAVVAASKVTPTVAGKPQPHLFLDAVRRCGGSAPLVVGDRLDTDLEGARAAGIPGLVVLTGVTQVPDLLSCPPHRRPDYVGRDLSALFDAHPEPVLLPGEDGARCRDAVVRVVDGVLQVSGGSVPGGSVPGSSVPGGQDGLDVLRAACACAWSWADRAAQAGTQSAELDPGPVVSALQGDR